MINSLLGVKGLARTSSTPGRTQALNFFLINQRFHFVDLPGYGYATGPEKERLSWRPLIDALRPRQSLRGLFLIVDSRRGLTEGDRTLLDWACPDLAVHILLSRLTS